MNSFNQKTYEQIESFLKGEMSGNELQNFKLKLKQDPDLQAELDLHKDAEQFFQTQALLHSFKEQVRHIKDAQTFRNENNNLIKWIGIAASILMLGGMSLWALNQSPSSDKLYAKYFETPGYFLSSANQIERGVNSKDQDLTFKKAKEYFDTGAFEQSLELLLQINDSLSEAAFHKGILYMHLTDWEIAIEEFELSKNIRPEASAWYQGLAYLKLKNYTKSIEKLKALTTYRNPYRQKAFNIIKHLQNN